MKAMFSRSAGVEAFVDHPRLPKAPLGKIEPSGGDPMMTEYVIMHVLRFHRDMPGYQRRRPIANGAAPGSRGRRNGGSVSRPRPDGEGAGTGAEIARLPGVGLGALAAERREIPIFHGADQLETFLNQTDIAVCLLPLTRETEGIFCARTFAMMPKGAMVINVGRGKHVVEADLIKALDSGNCPMPRSTRCGPSRCRRTLMAAPEGHRDAACRAATDRGAAGDRDRRQHPQYREGRRAAAGNRQEDGILSRPYPGKIGSAASKKAQSDSSAVKIARRFVFDADLFSFNLR